MTKRTHESSQQNQNYYPQHKNAFKKSFSKQKKKTQKYEKIKNKNFERDRKKKTMNKYCFRYKTYKV